MSFKTLFPTPITDDYFRNNSGFSYTPFSSNTATTNTRTPMLQSGNSYNTNGMFKRDSTIPNPIPDPNSNNSTFAQNAEVGVNIAGATMGTIGGMSNMVLGWANYAEQKKNSEAQRALAAKQLENLTEIMQQRKDELARLNRVRGNTKRAFNSNTTVTRSVL